MKRKTVRLTELALLACMFATGAALSGCEEGPVEETGEEIDDAADEVGDELD